MAGKVSDSHDCLTCGAPLARYWLTDYCGDDCRPRCDAEGCERPRTGSGNLYCRPHMSSIYKLGRLPQRTWAESRKCVVCGATDWPENGKRKHCSGRCQQLAARSAGEVSKSVECVRCGVEVDLFETSPKSGRKRRADALMCWRCREARTRRHRVSVRVLLNRDGDGCGICGERVDFDLRFPDRGSPSVDHVVPFSRGGSHDPSNLQLAHFGCNATKQARVDWTPAAS